MKIELAMLPLSTSSAQHSRSDKPYCQPQSSTFVSPNQATKILQEPKRSRRRVRYPSISYLYVDSLVLLARSNRKNARRG